MTFGSTLCVRVVLLSVLATAGGTVAVADGAPNEDQAKGQATTKVEKKRRARAKKRARQQARARVQARAAKVKKDAEEALQSRAWHVSLSAAALAQVDSAMTRGMGLAAFGLSQAVKSAEWINQNPVLVLLAVPVRGSFQMTSVYGMRRHPVLRKRKWHKGIDLAAKPGTPVVASGAGVVLEAGFSTGYGRLIVIDHGDGISTRYGHLRRIRVKPGQKVAAGQSIGNVGQSGRATGPHLHFEVRLLGEAVDPSENVGFALGPPVALPDRRVAHRLNR